MNGIIYEQFKKNLKRILVIESTTNLSYTYEEIFKKSLGVANYLFEKGIRKGAKVGIILNNCVDYMVIYCANMFLGAISIPINPHFNQADYEFILGKCKPDLILTFEERMGVIQGNPLESQYQWMDIYAHHFDQITAQELGFPLPKVEWDDPVSILFTSGTTGRPKGVIMKFGAVFENFKQFGLNLGFHEGTRFMQVVPLFHAHGWLYCSVVPILFGASLVLNEPFGVKLCLNFWEIIAQHQANVMVGVPSMLTAVLQLKDRLETIPQGFLNYVICGSAFLNPKLKEEFENTFGTTIYEFYGSTETLYISYHHPKVQYKRGSVGKVIPQCEIRIEDDGEILAKTKYLFGGYLEEKELTDEVLEGGWYKSGDLGRFDQDGYLFLTGRKKDLINKGGFKISPKEINDALLRRDEVVDAATIGVPDNMYGEEVYSFVHLKEDSGIREDDLYEYCKSALNPVICPRRIIILKVIPKNAVGKVDKFKLGEIVEKSYRQKASDK